MSAINGLAERLNEARRRLEEWRADYTDTIVEYEARLKATEDAQEALKIEARTYAVLGETVIPFESPTLEVKVVGRKKWILHKLIETFPKLSEALTIVEKKANSKAAQALLETEQISYELASQCWEADTPAVTITLK